MVVGLGNPGDEYRTTRHNAGFMVADRLIRRHGLKRPRRRYEGRWVEGEIDGRTVAVLMPQTYMNSSGDAVSLAAKRKHIPTERIVVIHDDVDFPFGIVRAKHGGGHGGHNGLKSIVKRLGSDGFSRVRVGIGRPEGADAETRDWVLTPFDEPEDELGATLDRAAECVEAIITGGIEVAMGRFNRREEDDSVT
ncbi:MAG: aminoacyl-tRNA hydrolase [Actinobacteria bacterium]|nr:aminoacyl-tRNA hydrolase [Actinomycetota bacterium]